MGDNSPYLTRMKKRMMHRVLKKHKKQLDGEEGIVDNYSKDRSKEIDSFLGEDTDKR